jgi:hypothetical protein
MLPLTISFAEGELKTIAASVAAGLIAASGGKPQSGLAGVERTVLVEWGLREPRKLGIPFHSRPKNTLLHLAEGSLVG